MLRPSTLMLRRSTRTLLAAKGNAYVDGTGRKLDGSELPTDLYQIPLSDDKYPVRSDHWQPVVAGSPSPYKGNIVVTGGGIVGCAAGCMFALRGWHVTILEKKPPPSLDDKASNVEYCMLTKRSVDALHAAGVRLPELKALGGRKVTGMLEHNGNISTLLTKGIVERTAFPVNMLTVNMNALRHLFVRHVEGLPSDNARIFHNHTLAAIFPDQKTAVVKPLREHERDQSPFHDQMSWESFQRVKTDQETKDLTTEAVRWEDNVEGIDYDVMLGCDGANSKLREMLKMGENHFTHWGVFWFNIKNSDMRMDCVHFWGHEFKDYGDDSHKNLGYVQAYPQSEDGRFAVMCYMPVPLLEELNVETIRDRYCKDMSGETDVVSPYIKPHPTVFVQNLINAEAFPNVMLMGDAAHACSPIMNQALGIALEDVAFAVNTVDSGKDATRYQAMRTYSRDRGTAGDALRIITERHNWYTKRKQWNAFLRFRNFYSTFMHYACPRIVNEYQEGSGNYLYPRSMSTMLNGRGYTSYELIEWQQHRANRWWCLGRIYS